MAQLTDPFVALNWGWNDGESGWGSGMNENLILYAFFHNKRIDAVLATGALLPASPIEGQAFFVESDKNVYIRANSTWYNTLPPVGMTFVLKTDESVVKYNGTTLVADTKSIAEVTGLQAALDAKIPLTQKGAINGVAPLGADGKVPLANLPAGESYLGTWNASTNTPTIVSGVGTTGEYYKVSNGGSTTIDGVSTWGIGDEIKFNGTVWQRIPNTAAVSSVNGQTGAVVLTNTDVGAAATSHSHSNATTSVSGFMSNTDKTKLDGIATGATANSSDATLLNRSNHTGTQASSTISDLTETVQDIVGGMFVAGTNTTVTYNDGANTIAINASGGGGSATFTGLSDVPDSYVGQGNKVVRVNSGETAVEFVSLGTAAFNNTGDFATTSHTHDATAIVSGTLSDARLPSTQTGKTFSSTVDLQSNLNFTGTTSRLTADFSNATHGNRLIFQTSTANVSSGVGVIANGTGAGGYLNTYSGSDPNNASLGQFYTLNSGVALNSSKTGTGTTQAMYFKIDGTNAATITTGRNVLIGTDTDSGYKLDVNGSGRIQNQVAIGGGTGYTGSGNNNPTYAQVGLEVRSRATEAPAISLHRTGIAAGVMTYNSGFNFYSADGTTLENLYAGGFNGSGAGLTSLNASNISSGTLSDGRLPTTMSGKTFSSGLTVNHNFSVGSNGATGGVAVSGAYGGGFTLVDGTKYSGLFAESGSLKFYTDQTSAQAPSSKVGITLAASGNTLIGTSVDLGYKLRVSGTSRFDGTINTLVSDGVQLICNLDDGVGVGGWARSIPHLRLSGIDVGASGWYGGDTTPDRWVVGTGTQWWDSGTKLAVKYSTGNVLINTTVDNGTDKLQVSGTSSFSTHVKIAAGDVALGGNNWVYSHSGGSYGSVRCGINFNGTANTLDFYTATAHRGMFHSDGNFSIGTSTNNGYKLDVVGTARITGSLSANAGATVSGGALNISSHYINMTPNYTINWGSAQLYANNAESLGFISNTANSSIINLFDSVGDFQGGLYSDASVCGLLANNGTVPLYVQPNAVVLQQPTTAAERILIQKDRGASPTYSSGHLELNNNGSGNPVVLGFHRSGSSACALVHDGGNNLRIDGTGYGDQNGSLFLNSLTAGGTLTANQVVFESTSPSFIWRDSNSSAIGMSQYISYRDSTNTEVAWQGFGNSDGVMGFYNSSRNIRFYSPIVFDSTITGNGSGLTSLNASNLSSGLVPFAVLPAGNTAVAGILMVTDSVSSASVTTAASPNSVRSVYLLANQADALAQTSVQKATPSQIFQSIGSVSGSVSITGSSGTHVLATAAGNITWTFPSPSASEAMALTLELTNGGAFTMTWPAGIRWTGGVAPTLTASGTDILVFTKAGTNNWRGYLSSKDNK